MANRPSGFAYQVIRDDVLTSHHSRCATTLRGAAADRFMADIEHGDPQQLMARVTDNYRHGNERTAKEPPRNQRR